jgi:excisionase family DNA binding protein
MEPRAQLSLVARPDAGSAPSVPPERLWTVKQAAEWLSISEQSLRTMMKRRQLPAQAILKLGRRVRFRSDVLRDWALRQCSA